MRASKLIEGGVTPASMYPLCHASNLAMGCIERFWLLRPPGPILSNIHQIELRNANVQLLAGQIKYKSSLVPFCGRKITPGIRQFGLLFRRDYRMRINSV
jgi:hypothetical protein